MCHNFDRGSLRHGRDVRPVTSRCHHANDDSGLRRKNRHLVGFPVLRNVVAAKKQDSAKIKGNPLRLHRMDATFGVATFCQTDNFERLVSFA